MLSAGLFTGNSGSMPPPAPRLKAQDDDIFGDAGTDYVCELPKVGLPAGACLSYPAACYMLRCFLHGSSVRKLGLLSQWLPSGAIGPTEVLCA